MTALRHWKFQLNEMRVGTQGGRAITATRGSLIGGATLDQEYAIGTAIDVSYEFGSAATAAEGYIEIPYRLIFAAGA